MNHPYLYPDECPWEQDYHDLRALRANQPLTTDTNDKQEDDSDLDFDDPI